MRTVEQIITLADPQAVEEAYQRLYEDNRQYAEHFERYRHDLLIMPTIRSSRETLTIRFREVSDGYDVIGVGEDGRTWALDFTVWGEWKAMKVDSDLPLAEQAAHLFEEMTWYGGPEKTNEARLQVEEAAEEFGLSLDDNIDNP